MDTGSFLPTTLEEMHALSIDQLDVIVVTGDAYVDHPAFGAAMVGRYVQSLGLTVGIIAMPDVKDPRAFTKLDAPRYFFAVTAGNVDSMLSLFTAQKKIRGDDPYVPGGMAGVRPQRATIAYCNAIRRVFKDVAQAVDGALIDEARRYGTDRARGVERTTRVAHDRGGVARERVERQLDRHTGDNELVELDGLTVFVLGASGQSGGARE